MPVKCIGHIMVSDHREKVAGGPVQYVRWQLQGYLFASSTYLLLLSLYKLLAPSLLFENFTGVN